MAWLSLRLGAGGGTLLLYLIAGYYFVFAPRARRYMRDYLRRALGREPRAQRPLPPDHELRDHDPRSPLPAGRPARLFEVSLRRRSADPRGGASAAAAHSDSARTWAASRCCAALGERQPGLKVAMAMYEDNARKLNAMLAAPAPRDPPEIIALGHIDAMLKIRERLDQAHWSACWPTGRSAMKPSLPVELPGRHARACRSGRCARPRCCAGACYSCWAVPRRQPLSRGVRAAGGLLRHARAASARRRSRRRSRATRRCWNSTAAAIPTTGSTSSISGRERLPQRRASRSAAAEPRCCASLRWRSRWRRGQLQAAAGTDAGAARRLMALLAQRRHGEADFERKEYLSVLKQPLRITGVLIYDAPDHLEQRTLQPRPQSVVLDHGVADACSIGYAPAHAAAGRLSAARAADRQHARDTGRRSRGARAAFRARLRRRPRSLAAAAATRAMPHSSPHRRCASTSAGERDAILQVAGTAE